MTWENPFLKGGAKRKQAHAGKKKKGAAGRAARGGGGRRRRQPAAGRHSAARARRRAPAVQAAGRGPWEARAQVRAEGVGEGRSVAGGRAGPACGAARRRGERRAARSAAEGGAGDTMDGGGLCAARGGEPADEPQGDAKRQRKSRWSRRPPLTSGCRGGYRRSPRVAPSSPAWRAHAKNAVPIIAVTGEPPTAPQAIRDTHYKLAGRAGEAARRHAGHRP